MRNYSRYLIFLMESVANFKITVEIIFYDSNSDATMLFSSYLEQQRLYGIVSGGKHYKKRPKHNDIMIDGIKKLFRSVTHSPNKSSTDSFK